MTENLIKFPCAYHPKTGKYTTIKGVKLDEKLNYVCPECRNSFIAVLKHKTPHFKHKPNSTCEGSFESNIHWLTKEIFKTLDKVVIPEIKIADLPQKQREKFQLNFNRIMDANIPEKFRPDFRKACKNVFINEKTLLVNKIETEKQYESDLGNVVIDVILHSEDEIFFIEPHYSNPISDEKKKKLLKIGTQTLSINLSETIGYPDLNFNLSKLKKYLISKESKKWTVVDIKNFDKHLESYNNHLYEIIELSKSKIELYNINLKEIEILEKERNKKSNKINEIKNEIEAINYKIGKINQELDF